MFNVHIYVIIKYCFLRKKTHVYSYFIIIYIRNKNQFEDISNVQIY